MKFKFYTAYSVGWTPFKTKSEAMVERGNATYEIPEFVFEGSKRQFKDFIEGVYRGGFYNKKTYNPKLT